MLHLIIAPATSALLRSLLLMVVIAPVVHGHNLPLAQLTLPPGFSIDVFAEVTNPRQLARSPEGVIFAGSRRRGEVYAIVDADNDYSADKVISLDHDLQLPSGVAFRNGDLYVATVNKLLVYRDIVNRLDSPPEPELVAELPGQRHHGWKYIDFGPDGNLYFNVGAPCNICLETDPQYATIMSVDLSTTPPKFDIFASGVRNSVGFAWHPVTKELWFTDNGRDHLGDELPPCELNHAPVRGHHFGFPYIHGRAIPDPEFGNSKFRGKEKHKEFRAPEVELGAHVAPLGMLFYDGGQFPEAYRHAIFIAEHGSWNRSIEAGHVGYRVTVVKAEKDGAYTYEPFIQGWLKDNVGWGRPADLMMLPDGSLLIADDTGNAIYRVSYTR